MYLLFLVAVDKLNWVPGVLSVACSFSQVAV